MKSKVKETPLLFSDEMVRALLSGKKTQTRRIVKAADLANLSHSKDAFGMECTLEEHLGSAVLMSTPFGLAGDRIWVRETWAPFHVGQKHELPEPVDNVDDADGARYRADGAVWMCSEQADACIHKGDEFLLAPHRWKPSIFMPRWACRIHLDVVSVRVERLQSITPDDASAEGCDGEGAAAVAAYRALWDSVHARGTWHENPFVWVVTFKKSEVRREG